MLTDTSVQMRIILLFIVIISSATEEVKKNLTGTEGGSITLPDPVVEFGFLSFRVKTVAMVNERKVQILEEIYKDKVLWDSNTGLFTITGLQRNDSGIYNIDSKKGIVLFSSYKLTVYESVSTLAVTKVSVSVTESCTLLCSVEKGEETTLSWYKDEELVNQSSSALSLPLTVHQQEFNSSYRCVAANPAENKTLLVNVSTSCSRHDNTDTDTDTDPERNRTTAIVVSIVLAVVIILVTLTIKWKYYDKKKRTTRHTQDSVNRDSDVPYTDIQILEGSHSQGGHPPDSSGPVDRSNLTTVYDKLEVHRMHIDTAVVYN